MMEIQFAYEARKDGDVRVYWNGKPVVILRGEKAARFLAQMSEAGTEGEEQLLMARVTGNFKRGNERLAKTKRAR